MELGDRIREVFSYIDSHQDKFICLLGEAVAIPSVSQQKEFRNDTIRVVAYFKSVSNSNITAHLYILKHYNHYLIIATRIERHHM